MKATERLVAFFVLCLAALLWPLLGIVNRPARVAGIPLLVLYLFSVWGAIVLGLFVAARGLRRRPDAP